MQAVGPSNVGGNQQHVEIGGDVLEDRAEDPNVGVGADPDPNVDQRAQIEDWVDRFVEGWNRVIVYGN